MIVNIDIRFDPFIVSPQQEFIDDKNDKPSHNLIITYSTPATPTQ